MKIIINAITAKKGAGGCFQIAINFIRHTLQDEAVEWYYVVSKDIDDVLGEDFAILRETRYFVFPTQPDFKGTYFTVKKDLKSIECKIRPNVVYSISAPSYFTFKAKEVMRFTNPWVMYPNKYAWETLSLVSRLRQMLYCFLQKKLIKSAYAFITQTDAAKESIMRITHKPSDKVRVVNNVLPDVFRGMDNTPIYCDEKVNIACIGNPFPHKNFDIISNVVLELDKMGYTNVCFHTTIPEDSPIIEKVLGPLDKIGLSDRVVNHGRVSQVQLGEIYRTCQLCLLPTLLEVFSASAIEAMYYGLPIIATDLVFNHSVLEDSCLYYEPKNAVDAAGQIAKMINDSELRADCRKKMSSLLKRYDDYDAHFCSIRNFLIEIGS